MFHSHVFCRLYFGGIFFSHGIFHIAIFPNRFSIFALHIIHKYVQNAVQFRSLAHFRSYFRVVNLNGKHVWDAKVRSRPITLIHSGFFHAVLTLFVSKIFLLFPSLQVKIKILLSILRSIFRAFLVYQIFLNIHSRWIFFKHLGVLYFLFLCHLLCFELFH